MAGLRVAIASLLLLSACSEGDDGASELRWAPVITDLDAVVLAAWRAPGGGGGGGGEDVFFVGEHGLALRFDGQAWYRFGGLGDEALWWVWGSGAADVWAGGEAGTLLHFDGRRWGRVATPLDGDAAIYGIWGASAGDVWLVGGHPRDGGPGFVLRSGGGSSGGGLFHFVELGEASGRDLFKVWGSGSDDVWIVGDAGVVLHWDGARLSSSRLVAPGAAEPDRLVTVAGRGSGDVFAVGGSAIASAFHYDGSSWRALDPPLGPALAGISATTGEPALAVGYRGTALTFDGLRWANEDIQPPVDYHAVVGLGGGRAFAVGGQLLTAEPPRRGTIALRGGGIGEAPQILEWPGEGADGGALDLAMEDAGSSLDLALGDASGAPVDQSVAGGDAGGLGGPGDRCGSCAPGLECWWIQAEGFRACIRRCASPADCGDFGPGARCIRPGCQVLTTYCLRAGWVGCPPPPDLL